MSFDPIQPDQMNIPARPDTLTNTVRAVVGGSLVMRPTFAQKFMSGLKMFGAMFAKIGGSLLKFFPFPGAQIASAGLYGLGQFAQQSYQNGIQKRMNDLAMDEASANANLTALTPGFGMFGTPTGAPTMAPTPNQDLAWNTVLNREAAANEQISRL